MNTPGGRSAPAVMSAKYSPFSPNICAAYDDGNLKFHDRDSGYVTRTFRKPNSELHPASSLRFLPKLDGGGAVSVLVTDIHGGISLWKPQTAVLAHEAQEPGNQIYCCDVSPDGERFVTGGHDAKLRVYETAEMRPVQTLEGSIVRKRHGHSARIFAAKYIDAHTVASGGWDNSVLIWDTRTGAVQRSIFGPYICGDAIDHRDGTLVTGSCRAHDQLEAWDLGSGQRIDKLAWNTIEGLDACSLYAAAFSPDGAYIAGGGGGANEARVFRAATFEHIGSAMGMRGGVYSLDFNADDEELLIASGDGSIRTVDLAG